MSQSSVQTVQSNSTNLHRGHQQHHLSPERRPTHRQTDDDRRPDRHTHTHTHTHTQAETVNYTAQSEQCSAMHSLQWSSAFSRNHTGCLLKPGLPLSVCVTLSALRHHSLACVRTCCMQVSSLSARHITFSFMFHRSATSVRSSFPLRSPSFPPTSIFPLPLLNTNSHFDLALPFSFSFPRENVSECGLLRCDITPGFPPLRYLAVFFPSPS